MLTLTYEYKANPTPEQIQLIEHTLDVCRKVWNFALCHRDVAAAQVIRNRGINAHRTQRGTNCLWRRSGGDWQQSS